MITHRPSTPRGCADTIGGAGALSCSSGSQLLLRWPHPAAPLSNPPQPGTTTGGDVPSASEIAPRAEPALADAVKVAVFGGFDAPGVANALNTDPRIVATVVDEDTISSGLPGYAALVVRLSSILPTVGMRKGLRRFVRNGGGVVGEWWGAGALLSGVFEDPSNPNFAAPERSVFLFAGLASGGNPIKIDHPVRMTKAHPVTAGLPDVLRAGGSTEFFVQSRKPRDLSLKTVATYVLDSKTYPAIQVGRAGRARAALLFFDAGDEPETPDITRLFINSVYWAAS